MSTSQLPSLDDLMTPPRCPPKPHAPPTPGPPPPGSPANDSFPLHQPKPTELKLSASEEELAEELVNTFMAKLLGRRKA
ncbi:MAG: hypothetical protein NZX77_05120 [Polyangiaceae bacterium]|nr:hypothetical protein [Polyangiaceae bacterium]